MSLAAALCLLASVSTPAPVAAAAMVNWIKAFSDDMHARTSKYPMIYTTFAGWNTRTGNSSAFAATNPFWIASYGSTPPASVPAGTPTDSHSPVGRCEGGRRGAR